MHKHIFKKQKHTWFVNKITSLEGILQIFCLTVSWIEFPQRHHSVAKLEISNFPHMIDVFTFLNSFEENDKGYVSI